MATNVNELLSDLDGGVFEQKLSQMLTEVGQAAVNHGRVGKVTVEFTMKQIGQSSQITLDHKLSYTRPTSKGKVSEENTTQTPVYVSRKGLTLFPENQTDMFDRTGNVVNIGKE